MEYDKVLKASIALYFKILRPKGSVNVLITVSKASKGSPHLPHGPLAFDIVFLSDS